MSITPSLPTYTEINEILKKTPGKYHVAEAHGLMCGLICATSGKTDTRWEILLGNKKDSSTQESLLRLYEISYHQMSEFSFEFSLLLPDDMVNINQRTEALGLWCQGYLTGLNQGGVSIENRKPGEVTEAINDIIEISQVNYGDITADEEDETAYFELVEYVRLAVLMIFHELKSNSSPLTNENNLLH